MPLAETVEAMERLRAEGQIRYWGVSNLDRDDMTELAAASGTECAANQILVPLKHAPEFQAKIGCDLSDDVSFGKIGLGGNATHNSSIVRNNLVTPGIVSPNVTVFDAQQQCLPPLEFPVVVAVEGCEHQCATWYSEG